MVPGKLGAEFVGYRRMTRKSVCDDLLSPLLERAPRFGVEQRLRLRSFSGIGEVERPLDEHRLGHLRRADTEVPAVTIDLAVTAKGQKEVARHEQISVDAGDEVAPKGKARELVRRGVPRAGRLFDRATGLARAIYPAAVIVLDDTFVFDLGESPRRTRPRNLGNHLLDAIGCKPVAC